MPSPIGHALGGAIVALSFFPLRPSGTIGTLGTFGTVVVAAIAPDFDFLWGRHSMETHSVAAALVAGLAMYAWKRSARLAVAVTLAWVSHILFDWLGSDTTPPIGVMALWPFSSEYYFANAFFFEAISRRYWLDNFISHNLWAVAKEVMLLGPILAVAWFLRKREERSQK